ncbi:MAG: transglutaminase-like domain-containing protein [Oscillospiraceae bacterium]|nr:transglutaminase-like domain-containing protein [Oscillospiraceae bacterium]
MKRKFLSALAALTLAASTLTGCSADSGSAYRYEYTYRYVHSTTPYYSVPEMPGSEQSGSETIVPGSSVISSSSKPTVSSTVPDSPSLSKPAQTPLSSSSTPSAQAPAAVQTTYRVKVLDTKSEEFVAYTTGGSKLDISELYTPYLYDFSSMANVGYSLSDTNNQLPVEADYGIRGKFEGSLIWLGTYDHTNKNLSVTEAYLEGLDRSVSLKEKLPLGKQSIKSDMINDPNGLYRVTVTFSNNTTCKLYFLINGDEYLFCQMIGASSNTWNPSENIDKIRARRSVLNDLIKKYDITPQNSLDVDIIQYPYYGINGWRRDTDKWAALSDEITDPSWSADRKLYAICDWLSQNIAYDYYVSNVLHDNRSRYYNVLDGAQSVWDLKSGVCRDYGQILTIMCRRQGIPADVISNPTHIWNVVYINGRWIEVDICDTNRYSVSGEDTTKRNTTYNTYKNFLSRMGTDCSDRYGDEIRVWLYMGQCY